VIPGRRPVPAPRPAGGICAGGADVSDVHPGRRTWAVSGRATDIS